MQLSLFFVCMTCVCAACSIEEVLHHIDTSIQYGEDADVKIRDFDNQEDNE